MEASCVLQSFCGYSIKVMPHVANVTKSDRSRLPAPYEDHLSLRLLFLQNNVSATLTPRTNFMRRQLRQSRSYKDKVVRNEIDRK